MSNENKTHFRKAFDSPYLSSADIVEPTVLTIKRVTLEIDRTKKTKDQFNTAWFVEDEIRPGEKLKPMILKDIAEKVGLDISTISRVANSKYVQTNYGTISLKFFFSESLTNEAGEEVSTREVKKILKDAIDAEDKAKPLTDDELASIPFWIRTELAARIARENGISEPETVGKSEPSLEGGGGT